MNRHTAVSRVGRSAAAALAVVALALSAAAVRSQDAPPKDDTMTRPVPPPANAKNVIVLFGGKAEDLAANWTERDPNKPALWPVAKGAMTTAKADIMTKERFTDFQLHLEWKEPYMPEAQGQGRGNSGVFLQGRYEIQVLDSYGKEDPGKGDCGAVYNQSAPLVNACKPPLQWQAYDITFRAPRFDGDGKMTDQGRVTVFQNGVCIQNNTSMQGVCGAAIDNDMAKPGPLILQFHGNKLQYRNIWIMPLPQSGATHY